ncbi:MAG TPA: alpha/beta hydrolase-fold protein [Vicinamibacterales bacterium]|jgi:predicted alpha/beta superfamily hydrolase|nr:alpha/beta hydrolase-fold protein [Vicinamibacterales bacterium]
MRPLTFVCLFLSLGAPLKMAGAVQPAPSLVPAPARTTRDTHVIERYSITSSILKQTRMVDVALPASFPQTGANRRYPVAVLFDGETNTTTGATVSGELARNGLIPEMILVGIENVDALNGRVYDLTPPGLSVSGSDLNQGGDRFLDFIQQELLPAVDLQFRGAAPRLLIGHSSGAILATYAAATRPAFRGVIAIDGPIALENSWLARKLIARAKEPSTPPLRYALYEAKFRWPDRIWDELAAVAPASWRVRRDTMRLEGHETVYMIAAYQGLREIFADYSRLAASAKPGTQMISHYDEVSAGFGAMLVPPRRLLVDAMSDLISEGRGAQARAAYDLLVAGYGAPPDGADWSARIADAERQPAPAETVEGLLKTPFPTPEEVRPFLGEWMGSIWMTAAQPRRNNITLRIRVENGRVIGETRNADAPPEMSGWIRVDYLRVTQNGLTWGRLNGMRPRGVMLWEGTLQGITLSGTGRWGGIAVTDPPGTERGFSFTRTVR